MGDEALFGTAELDVPEEEGPLGMAGRPPVKPRRVLLSQMQSPKPSETPEDDDPVEELFGRSSRPALFQRALGTFGLGRKPAPLLNESEAYELERRRNRQQPQSTTAAYRADTNPHRKLRHAAWKGDLERARQSIAIGASVECQDA